MMVLSRQVNETVLVGDDQTVTLVRMDGDRAVLRLEVSQVFAELSTEVALSVSESVPLPGGGSVVLVDLHGDKVRLGFKVPKHVTIHRAEVQQSRSEDDETSAPSVIADRSRLALSTGQVLQIGKISLEATDIDAGGVRFKVKGELVGGPEDGAMIDTVKELGAKGELMLGTRVTVTLLHISGTLAHLMVVKPPTMRIEVK